MGRKVKMRPRPSSPNPRCTSFRIRMWVLMWVTLGSIPVHSWAAGLQGKTEPDPLAQHYQAAQESLQGGDQERASREYKAFLGEAIHRVANARAHVGDLDAAAQCFDEAIAFAGPDTALRLDYASVLFDQSRWKEAESVAQSVVNGEPGNMRARVLLGRIFFEEKDYPAAKTQFEAALSHGRIVEVWRLLGIAYLRLQD